VVKTPITLSGGFSVETLTGATPSWKTELNRSISAVEDGIPGGLQHHHKMCCEKGGRCGRQACRVQRWHHRGDVVFWTGGLVYDKPTLKTMCYTRYITLLFLEPSTIFHVIT